MKNKRIFFNYAARELSNLVAAFVVDCLLFVFLLYYKEYVAVVFSGIVMLVLLMLIGKMLVITEKDISVSQLLMITQIILWADVEKAEVLKQGKDRMIKLYAKNDFLDLPYSKKKFICVLEHMKVPCETVDELMKENRDFVNYEVSGENLHINATTVLLDSLVDKKPFYHIQICKEEK